MNSSLFLRAALIGTSTLFAASLTAAPAASNYHYVTLRSSGALDIRKLVNGSIQTLASVPLTVQTNVTYRVRLEAIGTRLRAYVNGTLRAEATDAYLTRAVSSAGVATYKAAVDVENFQVSQP